MTVIQEEEFEESAMGASHINFQNALQGNNTSSILGGTSKVTKMSDIPREGLSNTQQMTISF